MADPVIVPCLEGKFTKVATNVTKGELYKMTKYKGPYFYTYRDTGEAAPTLLSEAVEIFRDGEIVFPVWERSAGIDIYIWAKDVVGSVRSDF